MKTSDYMSLITVFCDSDYFAWLHRWLFAVCWTCPAVLKLTDSYQQLQHKFASVKFKKKMVWDEVSKAIAEHTRQVFSAAQVQGKVGQNGTRGKMGQRNISGSSGLRPLVYLLINSLHKCVITGVKYSLL